MGQFKPMVKMETTEPSVILKLKKGGHVSGHSAMKSTMPMEMADGKFAAPGKAPKKPSIMERRKSMKAPMLMSKKGGDVSQDKAMIKKAFKEHDAQEHKGGKGTKLKLKNGGTTKVVDGDKHDSAHGSGEVKMGKPGGYAAGGTIEGNEGKFKNTKVVDGDKHDSASGTGGVRMANAGGFKNGGEVNWENRPADTAKPGKTNTKTGEVKESNAGGYKKGGAAKKHFATGGSVNNAGRAVAMPRKPVSQPVANSLQSGTFAKGGKVVSDWTVLNPSLKQKFNRVNAPAEKEEKPNLRLLKTHTGPKGHVAKVYKDKDWGEHRVKFFSPEGKHEAGSDYHTDDVEDAHGTAQGQLNRYKSGGKMVRKAEGGSMPMADDGYDPVVAREARRRMMEEETTRRENEATPVMDSVKKLLGMGPKAGAGRGFVNPPMARKTGGRAKR